MAQDISTTEIEAQATSNYRRPASMVEFRWDGTNYTGETKYVQSWSRTIESARLSRSIACVGNSVSGEAAIVLDNSTNRFSQLNSGSALYGDIGGNKMPRVKVRIKAGFRNGGGTPEFLTVFTGFVMQVSENTIDKTITMRCQDVSVELKSRRVSTGVYTQTTPGEYIGNLIDAVNTELTAEGRDTISTSLDSGRFGLDYAWAQDDSAWDEIVAIAEADGGRAYFDGSGVLRYEDASHVLLSPHTVSQYTFTTARYGTMIHDWNYVAPPINAVTVRIFPRYVAARSVIYKAGETLIVKPGETITHKAEFRQPAYAVVTPVEDVDYVAVTAGGIDYSSDISISHTTYSEVSEMSITNNNSVDTLYLTLLQLRGNLVKLRESDRVEMTDSTSIAQYGKQEMVVSNPYIQSRIHGEALAEFLLDREKTPKQMTSIINCPALPWLEVSDRITIQESDSGTDEDFFITSDTMGMDFSNPQDAKFTQTLHCLPVTNLFPYTNYFNIGINYLGNYVGKGRLFY